MSSAKGALRLAWCGGGILLGLFCLLRPLTAQEETPAKPQPGAEAVSLSLDTFLAPAALWETPGDTLVPSGRELGFRWVSNARDSAESTRKGITLFGLPVTQALIRLDEGKPKHVTALFFNRGDNGELSKTKYEELVRDAYTAISNATQAKPAPRPRNAASAVRTDGVIWTTPHATYVLEYLSTRESQTASFRAEFVRLEIAPIETPKSLLAEAAEAREKGGPFRGTDHIKRDAESGDVMIEDIPMVDQGQKGYCVVASAERVFRYYGMKVDANELAQLANSSASEGTSVSAMTDSLTKLTGRLRIRVRKPVEFEYRKFVAMIEDYNRAAKRAKADSVPTPSANVSITDIYGKMNPDLLREVRTKSKAAMTGFDRIVKTHIDKGVPILWSVILGVIPENGKLPQSAGGHMRLIIGYNDKTEEILYSDSWGRGHELKRMPKADAWAITTNIATLEPL